MQGKPWGSAFCLRTRLGCPKGQRVGHTDVDVAQELQSLLKRGAAPDAGRARGLAVEAEGAGSGQGHPAERRVGPMASAALREPLARASGTAGRALGEESVTSPGGGRLQGASGRPASVPGPAASRSRAELVASIYEVLCESSGGGLTECSMRRFVEATGLYHGDADWRRAYRSLCEEFGDAASASVDEAGLALLVDSERDELGGGCDDEELRSALEVLRTEAAPAQASGGSPAAERTYASVSALRQGSSPASAVVGIGRGSPRRSAVGPAASATSLAASPSAASGAVSVLRKTREELLFSVFFAFDRDGDRLLRCEEMRRFAELTGFDGGAEEWAEIFSALLDEAPGPQADAIDFDFFSALLSVPQSNCYLTDAELRCLLDELVRLAQSLRAEAVADVHSGVARGAEVEPMNRVAAHAHRERPSSPAQLGPARSSHSSTRMPTGSTGRRRWGGQDGDTGSTVGRPGLISALFAVLDRDADGFLSAAEMRVFAEHTGFQGSDGDWSSAYTLLCREFGGQPRRGVDEALFARLLDDGSEEGCYCTEDDVLTILKALDARFDRFHSRSAIPNYTSLEALRSEGRGA